MTFRPATLPSHFCASKNFLINRVEEQSKYSWCAPLHFKHQHLAPLLTQQVHVGKSMDPMAQLLLLAKSEFHMFLVMHTVH